MTEKAFTDPSISNPKCETTACSEDKSMIDLIKTLPGIIDENQELDVTTVNNLLDLYEADDKLLEYMYAAEEATTNSDMIGSADGSATALKDNERDFDKDAQEKIGTRIDSEKSYPRNDSLKMYFKEISKFDLLSKEEEVALAIRIKDGDETAKKELTNANLRLVVSIAKSYQERGLDLDDLIQHGNIGLMKAVDRFNHALGYRFSTYATWWIKQSITRGLADEGRTIRLPVYMVDNINKLKRTIDDLRDEIGRDATSDEIAVRMSLKKDKVDELLQIKDDTASLDTPIGEDEASYLGDFIADTNIMSAVGVIEYKALLERLDETLNKSLTERELKVLSLRFGLEDGHLLTLKDTGKKLKITPERVSQIECKALCKLRRSRRSKRLKSYL